VKPSVAIAMAAALAAAPLAPATAQAGDSPARFSATTLQLSAYGEVSVPPDMATLTLGVETTAATAVEASRANAGRMSQVVAAVKASGVPDRDIQTAQLSLSPQYAYEAGHPPRLTGYQASNQVNVVTHDLAKLGRVADFATGAGATNLGQISLGLANPVAAENSARVAAVKALEDKASLYAQATGYRITRLINLTEGEGFTPISPRPMMAMAKTVEAPTPIEAGQVKVRIDITGEFELAK
jgi:uncharacterized protein YggE